MIIGAIEIVQQSFAFQKADVGLIPIIPDDTNHNTTRSDLWALNQE